MAESGYIITTSGGMSFDLTDLFRPYREQLEVVLGNLDKSALWLWRLPSGAPRLIEDPDASLDDAEEYLQVGGSADGMVIEIRVRDERGEFHQYAIGKASTEGDTDLVDVPFLDDNGVEVPAREVFTAAEASYVLDEYRQTNKVPGEGYVARELNL